MHGLKKRHSQAEQVLLHCQETHARMFTDLHQNCTSTLVHCMRHLCSPICGGNNTFCSISSAQGVLVSPSYSSPAGKMPKNCGGRFRGRLH